MEFKARDFHGSNALWNYVMANASLRSYINHRDQSGLSRPNHKGKNEGYSQYNMHNVVNVNKAINDIIHTWDVFFGSNTS
jgi:hypothetical protein